MSSIRTPLTVSPHEYFGDATGRPLDYGTIYFGEPDKDPEFYPIDVYSDEALTQPIPQPIRTKGGFINVNGDIIEIYGRPAIYSVKVLDQYGRKIFYKGKAMRNNVNDDIIAEIDAAIQQSKDDGVEYAKKAVREAIDDTVTDGSPIADTMIAVDGSLSQRTINKGLESVADLSTIKNPKNGLRVYVKSCHAGLGKGGGYFTYDSSKSSINDGGLVIDGFVREVTDEWISAASFGLHPDNSAEDNSDILDKALEVCAGKLRLFIPPKLHMVARTIEIPSNTYIYSTGRDNFVFKMVSTTNRNEPLVITGHRGVHKTNIVIKSLGLDFNRDRWTVKGDGSTYMIATEGLSWDKSNGFATSNSALIICNSSNVLVEDVQAIDGYGHCIDITAPQESNSGSAIEYDPEPSYNVILRDILVSGHGDDGVTTHMSHSIEMDNITSTGGSGVRVLTNSNAVEIDDGSRDVRIGRIKGYRCSQALSIQGHSGKPSALSVYVDSVTAINCSRGVLIKHTRWNEPEPPEGVEGEGDSELSPSAYAVHLNNVNIIAPRQVEMYAGTQEAVGAFTIASYVGVCVNNLYVDDGTKYYSSDVDNILPSTFVGAPDGRLIATEGGNARGVYFGNVFIKGFKDLAIYGMFLAPRHGSITVANLVVRDGPEQPFYDGAISSLGGVVRLLNYDIEGEHSDKDTAGVRHGDYDGAFIGSGVVKGYKYPVASRSGKNTIPDLPYSITSYSQDIKQVKTGTPSRRIWLGTGVRAIDWTTSVTYSLGVAGGAIVLTDVADGVDGKVDMLAVTKTAVRAGSNDTSTLGLASYKWSEIFSVNGAVNTSDERQKQDVRPLSEKEKAVAVKLKDSLRAFKWINAVEKKGDDARIHFGVIAQDVVKVFESEGLNAHDYALLCYDEWEDEHDDNGKLIVKAGNAYGVRYTELLAFIISAI